MCYRQILLTAFEISFLTTLAVSVNINDMHSDMKNLTQHSRSFQDREILEWLMASDYALQKNDFMTRLEVGTGKWLLDSPEFQHWQMHSHQTLFCPGMPGAGKTMITSIVIDHLQKRFQSDSTVSIAYVYCNFKRRDEQKPEDLLSNLLGQLIREQDRIPQAVTDLYYCHKKRKTRPTFDDFSTILRKTLLDRSRVFILVDALDEYQASHTGWEKFLSTILELETCTGTNIFATSRRISTIENEFSRSAKIEIRAKEEDVAQYVDTHLLELPLFVSSDYHLQDKIKKAIATAVEGM